MDLTIGQASDQRGAVDLNGPFWKQLVTYLFGISYPQYKLMVMTSTLASREAVSKLKEIAPIKRKKQLKAK